MKDQSIIINLIQLYKMTEMFISVSHMCIIIIIIIVVTIIIILSL